MGLIDALALTFPPALPLAPGGGTCRVLAMDQVVDAPGDETLMQAWAGGEVAAFEALYARHRAPLFRFMLGHVHDRALAEELFQDVWQRVVAGCAGWRPDAPFGAWLYRIAHNRLADHWRAQKHRPAAPADAMERTATLAAPDDPQRHASESEAAARLYRALDELPPEQREVVLLRLHGELPLEEIARITGVGRETVKSRLRYAMDKLRGRLGA